MNCCSKVLCYTCADNCLKRNRLCPFCRDDLSMLEISSIKDLPVCKVTERLLGSLCVCKDGDGICCHCKSKPSNEVVKKNVKLSSTERDTRFKELQKEIRARMSNFESILDDKFGRGDKVGPETMILAQICSILKRAGTIFPRPRTKTLSATAEEFHPAQNVHNIVPAAAYGGARPKHPPVGVTVERYPSETSVTAANMTTSLASGKMHAAMCLAMTVAHDNSLIVVHRHNPGVPYIICYPMINGVWRLDDAHAQVREYFLPSWFEGYEWAWSVCSTTNFIMMTISGGPPDGDTDTSEAAVVLRRLSPAHDCYQSWLGGKGSGFPLKFGRPRGCVVDEENQRAFMVDQSRGRVWALHFPKLYFQKPFGHLLEPEQVVLVPGGELLVCDGQGVSMFHRLPPHNLLRTSLHGPVTSMMLLDSASSRLLVEQTGDRRKLLCMKIVGNELIEQHQYDSPRSHYHPYTAGAQRVVFVRDTNFYITKLDCIH